MNVYKLALLEFMDAKSKILENITKNSDLFLTNEDRISIMKLRNKTAERCWNAICYSVFQQNSFGLISQTCPFCYIYKYCSKCSYGKRHRICTKTPESDYGILREKIKKWCKENKRNIFTRSWYKHTLKKIAEKYNIEYNITKPELLNLI